ncbi:uncharacterized mitochondrial protein AtMg00810-like [Humulus lupulus]|uniref:uncharacterized mitochondrial protein AtMg00810-like n=1 Tax=Humulus lupulus TaxID=3486 RepID=UPI002B415CDD|nr:uncharacterized mitochondrial protein AtMg00810-like [Humulus lupulus]
MAIFNVTKHALLPKAFNKKQGVDFFETFSPVLKISTIRAILALAANSVSDSSLFYYRNPNVELYLLVYVDDILLTGNNHHKVKNIITQLKQYFSLKSLGSMTDFLGFEITQGAYDIHLSQGKYMTDLLRKTNMLKCKSSPTPISQGENLSTGDSKIFHQPTIFQSVMGGLQYLTLSRPDIAFTTVCKRLLRYLRGTIGLVFKPSNHWAVECFSDADWAGSSDDRKSTAGYCVYLGGNLITWCSKKQKAIAKSSTEVEYRVLSHTATEMAWMHSLFEELGLNHKVPAVN